MSSPAPYIDHTLLDLAAAPAQIVQLCQEAQAMEFAAVCIYPKFLDVAYQCQQSFKPAHFKLAAVIDFPQGTSPAADRIRMAQEAVQAHAQELDVVLNREWLRQKDYPAILQELRIMQALAPVKLILESSLLTYPEKITIMALAMAVPIMMAKTSTGVYGKATLEDVALLAALAGGKIGIKASGGIRTLDQAQAMLKAGATRLGTSHALAIMAEWQAQNKTP